MARLQQTLIERGWVTTRVLAAPQDLSQGTLALTVVPGRIAAIRFADGTTDRISAGETRNAEVPLSRLIYRDHRRKTASPSAGATRCAAPTARPV